MPLSDGARRKLESLWQKYVAARYPGPGEYGFKAAAEDEALFVELAAYRYLKRKNSQGRGWIFTEDAIEKLMGASVGDALTLIHQGDIVMGSKHTSVITGSNVGAVNIGDGGNVSGTLNVGSATPTQEQHRATMKDAQKALIDDEDRLDALVYESLGQFLRMAREIQVEQKSLAETQATMKATLDDVWAQSAAKGLKPQVLPEGLKLLEALARNPLMADVAKQLMGG